MSDKFLITAQTYTAYLLAVPTILLINDKIFLIPAFKIRPF